MIPFNAATYTGNEKFYIDQALKRGELSGDGPFGKKCQAWFEQALPAKKTLLTSSCTAALELAAMLIDIQPGDEVIMPSYTFVSTANAFVLRGAKVVFVDIRPDTMNINELLIEDGVTEKTRAIVPVHYAGVACEMEKIMEVANRYGLYVIEDAAQGMMSTYQGRALGTIGHMGTYSFHETKNYTSGGEGGLLIINDVTFIQRAEIIREKGTNRARFIQGVVDKYQWVDVGSSYLPSELQAAYLYGQLVNVEEILRKRKEIWDHYYCYLRPLSEYAYIELPTSPIGCEHNAHMFYIKLRDFEQRSNLIEFLKHQGIQAAFHYIPLHKSSAGSKFGKFNGEDLFTTKESERILRLPLHYSLLMNEVEQVTAMIERFFKYECR